MDCVYSISRRLGRPAKKKDCSINNSPTGQTGSGSQPNKKARGSKKKKVKEEPMPDFSPRERSDSRDDKSLFEAIPFDHNQIDDFVVEEMNLQTPTLMDIVTAAPLC
jgi:hypothetical protein